jgi:hypothetical protein
MRAGSRLAGGIHGAGLRMDLSNSLLHLDEKIL